MEELAEEPWKYHESSVKPPRDANLPPPPARPPPITRAYTSAVVLGRYENALDYEGMLTTCVIRENR